MPASFQLIAGLFRSGKDHKSWEEGDPYTFGVIAAAAPGNVVHFFGASTWMDEDHPDMRSILRMAKEMGFKIAQWERIDPASGICRNVEIRL